MKKFAIFAVAVILIASVCFVRAEEDESTEHLELKFPLVLEGPKCDRLFGQLLKDYNPHTEGLSPPYNTIFRDEPFDMDGLQWVNFTDTRLVNWNFGKCVVQYHQKQHAWSIIANDISASVETNWAYSWEPGMPVLDDSGRATLLLGKTTMTALLQRFNITEYFKDGYDKIDTVAPTVNHADDHVWRAFVTTWIPRMNVKTSGTEFFNFYDTMALKYDKELRFLMSSTVNTQAASWLNHYCLEHDCDKGANSLPMLFYNAAHYEEPPMVEHEETLDEHEEPIVENEAFCTGVEGDAEEHNFNHEEDCWNEIESINEEYNFNNHVDSGCCGRDGTDDA